MDIELYVGPHGTPVAELAERLNLPERIVLLLVGQSPCLVIRDGRVTFDERIVDPKYGPIYRKEAQRLRAERCPTLREIAARCEALRRRGMRWRRGSGRMDARSLKKRGG